MYNLVILIGEPAAMKQWAKIFLHRSNLGRRLKKLEVELTDDHGLVPHSAKWRAYWLDWLQKLVNGENPPGKITDEAFRTLQDEIVIPPYKYDDE